MARRRKPPTAELRDLLENYPDTGTMEVLIADMQGVLRGKRVQARDFDKLVSEIFGFCGGTVLMTSLGEVLSGIPYGADDGDPDLPCRLVAGSIAPIPWAERPMAQALFRMYEADGEPFFADPRAVLERALAPLGKMQLTPVMATELEFYLLEAKYEEPTPTAPRVPGTGARQVGAQVYLPDDLWEVEQFLNDVYDYCEAQAIPADSTIAEYSQGQFEINLQHVDDPVLACDHAVLLKRAVKAAARKHGFAACFMAKPFAEEAGNGLHIHMSILDKNGNNYFSQGRDKLAQPPYSARLRHAVGGLLKTMPDATAIFAPNANSYRRLRPEMYAPVEPNWGENHRAVAIRIPMADQKNLRFEHRVSGADANPYLVTAAIVAGVHHGLKNKIDPGRMIEEGEQLTLKTRIPDRWPAAIDKFSRSKVLKDYLGEEYCKLFVLNRRGEERLFHNEITTLDYDWYMRNV